MAMTARERLAKSQVQLFLSKQGYPTYAGLLDLFDLNLTKDNGVIAYVQPGKGRIVINENLDMSMVSVAIRHEILHEYLKHEKRLIDHTAKKMGMDLSALDDASINDLKKNLYKNKNFNIAGDFEISNRAYTEEDKRLIRNIELGGQVVSGLVTEDQHPDWVNLSIEEMYDKLAEEQEKLKQEKEQQEQNSRQENSQEEGSSEEDDGAGVPQSGDGTDSSEMSNDSNDEDSEDNSNSGDNPENGEEQNSSSSDANDDANQNAGNSSSDESDSSLDSDGNGGSSDGSSDVSRPIIIKGRFVNGQFLDADGNVITPERFRG